MAAVVPVLMTYLVVYYICRTLPLFVWHRQNWNVVYPNVDLEQPEVADLCTHGTYVAGFTDASVEGRTELYDIFLNGGPLTNF